MEKEEVGDDDDDEEAPLRERDLNLELRVAQEERHCTTVAMGSLLLPNTSSLLSYSVSSRVIGSPTCVIQKRDDV